MDQNLKNILNDLYQIEPELKAHEQELIAVVSKLMASKPDTHFDEQFAAQLRTELLETKVRPIPTPYPSFFVSRAFYGIVGSVLTILIVVPVTFIATQKATSPDKPVVLNPFSAQPQVKDVVAGLTPKQQISNKGMNAFGKLALIPTAESAGVPQTSSGMAAKTMSVASPTASASSVASSASVAAMPIPSTTSTITTQYKGDEVTLKDTQGTVFKRTKGIDSDNQLAGIIQKSNFGLANLSQFNALHLSTIQLDENVQFGYSITVNFTEGSIAINPEDHFWDSASSAAVASSSMPASGDLIALANSFVQAHGIDMTIYDKPIVQNNAGNVSVVYPLLIDGKPVYDDNGMPHGLTIAIDVQDNRVASVTNLTSQTYDSSMYTLETDFGKILAVATSSLEARIGEHTANISAITASLGTPKQVLMHYYSYDPNSKTNTELYIPALSFAVSYQAKNSQDLPTIIVVPLVKDFLEKQTTIVPVQSTDTATTSKSE